MNESTLDVLRTHLTEVTKKGGVVDVELFAVTILSSALTQYDRRQSKRRFYNPYALSQYFAAQKRVQEEVKKKGLCKKSDRASFEELIKIMTYYFDATFSPVKKVVKQIHKYLDTGKAPSIVKAG
jgi:nucleoid-associated protein YejK